MKTVLITGATSGIGLATAEVLAENNFKLILCGRREIKLNELARKLSVKTDVATLTFDIRDRESVFKALKELPENFRDIDILINNAGNAHGLAHIDEGDLEDWEAMIDINIKGLLYVTKAVLPVMVSKNSGHIINIGSIAGKVFSDGTNVIYGSAKPALLAVSFK